MTGWEDFTPGRTIVSNGVTVTEAHVVGWASLTGDWYPIHVDQTVAAASEFGGRIAHGPFIFGLAVGLLAQTGVYGDSIVAWLGTKDLRARMPVRLGDTVRVMARVAEARASGSRPGHGVVTLHCAVLNQADDQVMTYEFTLLMRSSHRSS